MNTKRPLRWSHFDGCKKLRFVNDYGYPRFFGTLKFNATTASSAVGSDRSALLFKLAKRGTSYPLLYDGERYAFVEPEPDAFGYKVCGTSNVLELNLVYGFAEHHRLTVADRQLLDDEVRNNAL